jgi:hypothetical protein
MITPRWARGANMRKPTVHFPCVVAMTISVPPSIIERTIFTGFMSGARAAGSLAGSACVQCAGHRLTDSDQTSITLSATFPFFFFSSVTNGEG